MSNLKGLFALKYSGLISAALLLANPAIAEEVTEQLNLTESQSNFELAQVSQEEYDSLFMYNETELDEDDSMSQVTDVDQLRDVSPGDWAYEALRSLVNRYGCIVGYPNLTYRGNRALSRYEFAAGLNACMNVMERLIANSEAVLREDIDKLKRLVSEFEAELATLGARVDDLEGRVAFLEDHQFSTTTKLVGEVSFTLAQAFGDTEALNSIERALGGPRDDLDSQVVFHDKVRLQLVSSFTGKDKLFTRLTAGNLGNSFQDETGTREGRFAHDGFSDNDVVIDRLHYVFPVGDKLTVTTMASLGAHHFYAEVFNDGINTGGGANGGLTRFSERNPIYRLGIARSTTGLGFSYDFNDVFGIDAGYLAVNGSDPEEERGLFNGSYSALAQLVVRPSDTLKFGLTYSNSYMDGRDLWGGTGTDFANISLGRFGSAGLPIISNSYSAQFQWDVSPKFSVRGWFTYTDADSTTGEGESEIWTYAAVLAFPDLGKEGNLGAIVVGAEPYMGGVEGSLVGRNFSNDTPLHVEAFYKYKISKNISVTPGLVWLINPEQDENNDDIFIGAIRTTFSF